MLLTAVLVHGQASDSHSASGDYQQYMKKYADGSQGGDYHKYVKEYAGKKASYQQYMRKYAGSNSQSGGYQQYMNKYDGSKSQTGNYQHYMKNYAGGQNGDYQQYMKKYAGGKGGKNGASATELLEQSPQKSDDSSVGSELDLLATKSASKSSSNANYQQYMHKYAGGAGGQGSYQKYMKQYAGGKGNYQKYMKEYAGSYKKYSDYQKYMKRYQNDEHDVIRSAHDANNTAQLDKWKSQSSQAVKWYVPEDDSAYARHDIDKKYDTRLSELDNAAAKKGGADAPLELFEAPPQKNDDSSVGSELDLVATKSASNANSNYQKYMQQYAGGAGGKGSYQKYMKQYAGGQGNYSKYMDKFAGSYEKYSDYQKYMKRYQNREHNEVRSAKDAKNKAQLDEWKSDSSQNVKWYVPEDEATYAKRGIDKKYETRLTELDNAATTTEGPFAATDLQEQSQPAVAARTFLAVNTQDVVKSNPAACAMSALAGVSFASLVFFAIRHRRSIQTPENMLG
jgi:hypothetical protein